MSYSYAYKGTSHHGELANFIVNCDSDKLAFTKTDNKYEIGDSRLPVFHIYWSNVNKFYVGQLHSGHNNPSVTREYQIEVFDLAQFPARFQAILGPKGEFNFSISDKRQGISLLQDASNLGCFYRMNPNGFRWDIFESNPAVGSTVFTGPKINIGRARASGSSNERQRTDQSLKENIGCPIRISSGKK